MITSLKKILRHNTRRSFIRDIVLVTLATTLLVLTLFAVFNRVLIQGVASANLDGLTDGVAKEFSTSSKILNNIFTFTQEIEGIDLRDPESTAALQARLAPFMLLMPQIKAMKIASSSGHEYILEKDQSGGAPRSGIGTPSSTGKTLITWLNPADGSRPEQAAEERKAAIEEAWYRSAVNGASNQEIHWTSRKIIPGDNSTGITGSFRIGSSDKVLAFEGDSSMLLDSAQGTLDHRNGNIFLLNPDNLALARFSHGSDADSEWYWFNALQDPDLPFISRSVTLFRDGLIPMEESSRFNLKNEYYWVRFQPLETVNRELLLGVIVNEKELSGEMAIWRIFLNAGSLLTVLAGLFWAGMMVRKYSARIREAPPSLNESRDFENDLMALINRGESETLEFKSTLRMNLRSGKAGKEIEIASLKTVTAFLNSNGGILLIGVNDEGEITGMEPDEFEDIDHCKLHFKNLLKQHIGLEFSESIQFGVHEIKGKTIGVVECSATDEPVFLYQRDKEEFYIRSGPASVSLPISKALAYLNN